MCAEVNLQVKKLFYNTVPLNSCLFCSSETVPLNPPVVLCSGGPGGASEAGGGEAADVHPRLEAPAPRQEGGGRQEVQYQYEEGQRKYTAKYIESNP
jgi:hypothetical protein